MEALNAVGLKGLYVLHDRRTGNRKPLSLRLVSSLKVSSSSNSNKKFPSLPEGLSAALRGGLLLVSSLVNTGLARALTYEEALQQSVGASGGGEFDVNGVFDTVISFGTENPAVIAGGVAALAVPLVLSEVLKKPKPWGVESAKTAYAKLGEDAAAQLLDIRGPAEFRQVGSPDIRGLSKKAVSIAYEGDNKPGFLNKLSSKFKEPENTTLFILDKFDGNSELVAELVTINGFKAAYAIKDGAEGPRGWMNSGLPWIPPRTGLSLDLGSLADSISDAVGDASDGLSLALGLAAATGLGLLAFTEVETVLQILGSVAILQFARKKLLFAENRKQTLKEVDDFLNTTVAPKELVDDIKQIGKALLPPPSSKALPSPAAENPACATSSTVQNAEATPDQDQAVESKVEAAAASLPEINSVPRSEVKAESIPRMSRPLSPYTAYPDLKPPTSPTPTQP